MPSRVLSLRRSDTCARCRRPLAVGARAWWDADARTVTCLGCRHATVEPPPLDTGAVALDRGRPGASVGREYRRRRVNRETRKRREHPLLGGMMLALGKPPRHESAFRQGERGEVSVGGYLERRTARGPALVLHDRRMPRGRGNIDELAIAPSGVFVIDVKDIKGEVRVQNPLRGSARLVIKGRNRTKLVDGLDRQVTAVRLALDATGHVEVAVFGVFCFTSRAEFPLLGTMSIRGHKLLHRRKLVNALARGGMLTPAYVQAVASDLAAALPPA